MQYGGGVRFHRDPILGLQVVNHRVVITEVIDALEA
jgi:hypothetical protein